MVGLLFLFFLFWPFGAVVYSIKNYKGLATKNVVWLFVIYYGFNFVLSNDTMDANRLKDKFEVFLNADFGFFEVIKVFYLNRKDGVDIIQQIVLYLAAKITDDFYILMGLLGGIFGFFYSRNIGYLFDYAGGKIKVYNYLIIWMFVFVIGFWQINAFRYWTSAVIYFFAVAPYIVENKKGNLWLAPATIFLHFSFLYANLILLIYILLRNRANLYFAFYMVSFFLVTVNVSEVGQLLTNLLPSNYHRKILAYTDGAYVAEIEESVKSISYYLRFLMFFFLNLTFTIIYLKKRRQIKEHHDLFSLFSFCLLIMAAANFISIIPSGIRFVYLSSTFSFGFIFLYLQRFRPTG